MRTYYIAIANQYQAINAPLIVNAGYYNTKMSGYECITKMASTEYSIVPYTDGIININNTTIMVKKEGSYTVFLRDSSQTDNEPVPFSFYAFQNVYEVNNALIEFIINQELPPLYKSTNPYNAIDIAGSAAVLEVVYKNVYDIFYNSITSLGVNGVYNSNWEYVYVGVNKLLQNAVYPSQFLRTLMNVNTQTSTQVFSLAITFSRLMYQLVGQPVPVQIVWDDGLGGYYINLYNIPADTWVLGIPGSSELDETTFLGGAGNGFLWLMTKIISRLMPAFTKWELQYLTLADFNAAFNVGDVSNIDFYNPDVLYDAYKVINNNNNFNTQGYLLNE